MTALTKVVGAPLPVPGPVKASERTALLRSRRPSLHNTPDAVPAKLGELYGREHWQAKLAKLKARSDLKTFVVLMWDVICPGEALVWNWHLDVLCDVLQKVTRGEITRLLINIPPGHAKSIICAVFWPAWNWLEDPSWSVLCATYVQKLSNRDSLKCRDLIRSKKYQELIPKVYGNAWRDPWAIKADVDNVETYKTTMHGERTATSVTGSGAGFRARVLLVDDPLNVEEWPTAESLESVISWFDKRMTSRSNDASRFAIIIIMQRLHENDLAGHVLAKDAAQKDNPHWRPFMHICFRSEYDPDAPNAYDKRTERGELLFPQRFPRDVIETAKVDLGAQYSAQHDQRPVSAAGGVFPMARLCFWYPQGHAPPLPHKEKDDKGNDVACVQGEIPRKFETQIQSWDCAFKDQAHNDFVAGQLWARAQARCYLITQEHGHFGFWKTIERIRTMSTNFPKATAKYIEDKANGTAIIETLKSEIFGIEEVEPDGGKEARAWAIEPLVRAGNVWLPHPDLYPWVVPLLNELRAFPRGRRDDQVDALTQGLRKLALSGLSHLEAMARF